MKYLGTAVLFWILLVQYGHAQVMQEYLGDESMLYAETKQMNQFFRRFNGEEDEEGKRYYPKDKMYRNPALRDKYLNLLFDNQNTKLSSQLKSEFVKEVNAKSDPEFLDFHAGDWFAEVKAKFKYKGKEEQAILFMKLERAPNGGSKWIFTRVHFEPYVKLFEIDTTSQRKFLHPLSHELGFMNLRKAFRDKDEVQEYTGEEYYPDFLSIFLYDIKNSYLSFITVSDVKFHFFQIEGWYFQINKYNRKGYNTGWLISDLLKVTPQDKDLLTRYIYYESE